ncbi:ArnT family glycosyltransferase [Granulicella cerasi]|uniref:ArnT family glycosyltransferase n=1 Tax=Granulicella cerasi TaxID=741063 RepID=A0ABW1Z852_9BACT|nr:glycosyltransferase family 39 protein [Granulicella cerasi]
MQASWREWRWWWLALACGFTLRAVFALHHPRFDGDTLVYGDLAQNMWAHHVYGLTEGHVVRPTLIRLPGYPLFTALNFLLFGMGNYTALVWVQIVLALAGCWALARSLGRMWGPSAGLAMMWLACLCPFTAEYDALALTESLAMVCLVAVLVGLERWKATKRWRWVWIMGAASAFAVQLRPDRGLLTVVCLIGLFAVDWRKALRPALLVCLLVALPILGWTVRNKRVMHVWQPLAPKYANDPGEFVAMGFNRWYRTWAMEYWSTVNVYWLWDGAVVTLSDLPARAFDSPAQRQETARALAVYNRDQAASPANDAAFAKLARERTQTHPLRTYVWMPVGRLLDMWLRPRTEFFKLPLAWWRWSEHPGGSLVCAAYAGLNLLLLVAAKWAFWRKRELFAEPAVIAGIAFVVLRSLLLLTIDNSEQRYTVECWPVVLLCIAAWFAAKEKPSAQS